MMSSGIKEKEPQINVLHATVSHFQNAMNYKTYRFFDKSQIYHGMESWQLVRVSM